MIGQKLFRVLEALSSAEVTAFRKYLQSPYFNERDELVQLFELWLQHYPIQGRLPADEKIWLLLFPNKAFEAVLYRRLFSDLLRLCRHFLSIQNLSPENQSLGILQALNQKDLDKQFAQERNKLDQNLKKQGLRNSDFFLTAFRAEVEQETYLLKQYKRSLKTNLDQKDYLLDCFFLSTKLKHYCNALNYKNVLNVDIPIGLVEALLEEIKDSPYLKEPAVLAYYLVMLTLKEPDQAKHFQDLRIALADHAPCFPEQELRDLYIFAQNYCIKKINLGQQDYLRALFNLYQVMLETRIIFADDELPPTVYKNIITLGLRLEEYDLTANFIRDYDAFLPDAHRSDAMAYNLAKLHFHKQEYDQVIQFLRDLEYRDVYYAVDGRWLLAKTYYETDEFGALDNLLDTFRLFLMRQKVISNANKTQYLKQVRYLKMLSKTLPSDKKRLGNIREKIQTTSNQAEKNWFLEKVDELLI
ncbi:MAG: hypothetical protein AAF598_10715 [Bacteroidota bacterium]